MYFSDNFIKAICEYFHKVYISLYIRGNMAKVTNISKIDY